MLFAGLIADLLVLYVPSDLLVVDVVQLLNHLVCLVAKRQNREVANSVEHVVVVRSPFVAVHYVVLLVLSELSIGERVRVLLHQLFLVLHNHKSASVVILELDGQARFAFLDASRALDFNRLLE